MRVAVAYDQGDVFSPFGETKTFKLYELEGKEIVRDVIVPAWGEDNEALSDCLRQYGANVLICGGIGGSAKVVLEKAGILTFGGVIGKADTAIRAFLNGTLQANPNQACDAHSCGGTCEHCGENCPGSCAVKTDK